MGKPREVFYVEQSGAKLRYGQKGGGLFARLDSAEGRAETMRRQGATAKVWRATVVWEEVTPDGRPSQDGTILGELSPDYKWVWMGGNAGWRPNDERV